MQKTLIWSLLSLSICARLAAQPRMMADTRPVRPLTQAIVADKNRVMEFFQDQAFDEAIAYLAPALGPDSTNTGVLGYLGYAYYMSDDNAAARQCYHRIFVLDSTNLGALHYLEALNHHDDPEMALDYTRRLVSLQPGKPLWWRTKGELQRRLKQPDSALADLTHAWVLAPEDVKNVLALADLLVEKKNYALADSMLDAALERDSMSFPLLKLRIRSAYNEKDYASVLAPGERVMRMNLPDVNVQSWLALSYYNLKRYPDCVRACEFLLNSGYDIEAVYYYEARALSKMQQYKESNELLAICLKKAISQTAGWYFNDRGDNFEGLKDYRAAIAQYDTAFLLFRDPLMLYNCGRVAESALNNEPLANKYYRAFLKAARPETADEKKVYAYVKKKMAHSRRK